MVIKIDNSYKDFYKYMGKFFGSRIVEKQTNDRIYDDDNKIWYLYMEKERVLAFVSISKNVIKNIYAIKEQYLEEILKRMLKENDISYSIVTNCYVEAYKKSGLKISENETYKNFVMIYSDSNQIDK